MRIRKQHGLSDTRAWEAWRSMRNRCLNPNYHSYPHYGGRGITICTEWDAFETFLQDMGHPPAGLSLDRVDNDGEYSKANCRWATRETQQRNTRRSAYIHINGERKRVRDVEISLGLSGGAIWHRLKKGWPPEKAYSTPKVPS